MGAKMWLENFQQVFNKAVKNELAEREFRELGRQKFFHWNAVMQFEEDIKREKFRRSIYDDVCLEVINSDSFKGAIDTEYSWELTGNSCEITYWHTLQAKMGLLID